MNPYFRNFISVFYRLRSAAVQLLSIVLNWKMCGRIGRSSQYYGYLEDGISRAFDSSKHSKWREDEALLVPDICVEHSPNHIIPSNVNSNKIRSIASSVTKQKQLNTRLPFVHEICWPLDFGQRSFYHTCRFALLCDQHFFCPWPRSNNRHSTSVWLSASTWHGSSLFRELLMTRSIVLQINSAGFDQHRLLIWIAVVLIF